jgi:hypothetical protein
MIVPVLFFIEQIKNMRHKNLIGGGKGFFNNSWYSRSMSLPFLKKHQDDHSSRYAAIISTLSLFIMLLAFFMMLNSKSQFSSDRVEPVLKSLKETFTTRVFRDDMGPSLRADPEQGAGEGYEAFQSLDSYFRTSFPGSELKMIPTRGIFYLELNAEDFEKKLFSDTSTIQKTLLEKLWTYHPLQMEIWINIQDDPGESSKNTRDQIEKLSVWATALEKQGLEKGMLTIGLQKGDPEKVIVLFHNYKPYAPEP